LIGSHATSRSLPDGGYHGVYKPFYTKEHSLVLGPNDKPKVFREAYEAETMAWRECKRVEREHLNYLRADPTQTKEAGRWYDRNTRMRAQAKAANADRAESVFRVREAVSQ
jgi:hypothetical protein